ncbi:PE family protein, partial [Mycobacterium canetti]|uniref:PE family protein n=1 Tax=Mycobacterium canetti TaxID=78331 RepID=UPI001E3E98D8
MSLVIVTPELVAAAASDVARIGSGFGAANSTAAGSTTSVLAAGADEVSAPTPATTRRPALHPQLR